MVYIIESGKQSTLEDSLKRERIAQKIRWQVIIWIVGLVNVAAMLPQLYRILTTHKTEALSIEMFVLYGVIQLALSLDGFFKRNTMLMVCMGLSSLVSTSIIGCIIYFR